MQKTIKYAMVALVAIIAIAGCKKEINWNAKPDPNGNGCKLASLKADLDILGTYTLAFTYDASGRISKATTTDGQTSNYVYTTNKITATDQDGNVSEIVLENGRAISSGSDGVISGGGVTYNYTRKYSYNTDGYLIQVKNYLNGELNTTDNLTYANGNLVKAVSVDAHLGYTETTTYVYSTENAVNTYEIADPLSYHVDYFPGGYFGKQSKNVLLKGTAKTVDGNGDPFTDALYTFGYQYDGKGNATSVSFSVLSTFYPGSGPVQTDTYNVKYSLNYTCK